MHIPKALNIQITSTLGPKVYKDDLLAAIWSPKRTRLQSRYNIRSSGDWLIRQAS